jgi:hypothetical protein
MGDFGRRNGAGAASEGRPRRQASGGPRQASPVWSDLISRSDLKTLEKGQLPSWATMTQLQVMGMALFVTTMVLLAVWFYAPEVARDLRYAGTYRVAHDLSASDGHCTRYMFLVTRCSANIQSADHAQAPITTHFFMFFRSGSGVPLVPVRSSADRSAVGIQYAVSEVLLNRTLSLLGVTLLFGWVGWTFFLWMLKGRYEGGPAHAAVLQYAALHASPA